MIGNQTRDNEKNCLGRARLNWFYRMWLLRLRAIWPWEHTAPGIHAPSPHLRLNRATRVEVQPACPFHVLSAQFGLMREDSNYSSWQRALCLAFLYVFVCPPLSGSLPSTTKSGLGTSKFSRGVEESRAPLICWQRNGWGDEQVPASEVNAGCSQHTRNATRFTPSQCY